MKKLILNLYLLIIAFFSYTQSNALNNPNAWVLHQGSYIGAKIGGNLNGVTFYINGKPIENAFSDTFYHSVVQTMFAGYYFKPHWALEGEVGSYFSGIGLSGRAAARGNIALAQRVGLSAALGGAYIATPLRKAFMGPYADITLTYALSKKVDLLTTVSDVFAIYQFSNNFKMTNHFMSILVGFGYRI